MKTIGLASCCLVLASLSFGQILPKHTVNVQPNTNAELLQQKISANKTESHSPLSTDQCSFTFSSGKDNGFTEYCVTANGNIPEFQFPQGFSLISSDRREGYGICDVGTQVQYSDFAGGGDSGNWGASSLLSRTTTSVKIARTTGDGFYTLTQTITRSGPSAKVTMALRNNTQIPRTAIVVRYTDVDADGVIFNNFDGTFNSTFGWNSSTSSHTGAGFGLELQNVGNPPTPDFIGFAQNTPSPPSACDPTGNIAPSPLLNIDGSLEMVYVLPIAPGKTSTVNMAYKGM